jgi:hypothetical protein
VPERDKSQAKNLTYSLNPVSRTQCELQHLEVAVEMKPNEALTYDVRSLK